MGIEVRNIVKRYGSFAVCDNLSLDIPAGELVALLGPSGSGKTTLLRIIAGLEQADAGQILLDGKDTAHTAVRERNIGFVFQHYALFAHLSVTENVAFGLRVRPRQTRPSARDIQARVAQLLKLVQLDGLAQRYPHQLSGGQRQRVALARALATEPKMLLLDEPFGALDSQVRKELRRWLRRLHDDMHVTSVFVTHDQEEAMEVADRIVIMRAGKIEQQGTSDALYDHPATPFVLQFLGDANAIPCSAHAAGRASDRPVTYVRPHDIRVLAEPCADSWPVTLKQILTLGPNTRLAFQRQDGLLVDVELTRHEFIALRERLELVPGQGAHLQPQRCMHFGHAAQ